MADAFTTVMSNLDTLRQKGVQYENDAQQIKADTVGMIMEDGAKLAKTLYTQKVEEDMTKLQNYLNDEAAKGTFDWIDGVEENGIEYNPEGIYNNYVNAANKWISENSRGLSTLGLKKSANSYLESLKAGIYSNVRSSNYDTVKQNSKNNITQLTSTSFDPFNENALNLKITAAFPDYSSVDDLANVTTYGLDEDVAEYKELLQRHNNGTSSAYDDYLLEEKSFAIQFKLNSIIAGENEYYYENYTSKKYDDSLLQMRVAQGVKAAASGVADEYIKSGADSDVITLAKSNFEAEILNNGLIIGENENGEDIVITAAEMGDTVLETAISEYSNTLTIQAANALKVQTTAWEDATNAIAKDYEDYGGKLPFTSADEYVKALMSKDSSLSQEYATAIVDSDAALKTEFFNNSKAEDKRKAIQLYLEGDTTKLFDHLREKKLLTWGSINMEWGRINDPTDDNKANRTLLDYEQMLADGASNEEIRLSLFSTSSSSSSGSSLTVFNDSDYYANERSRSITDNLDSLSGLAVQAITAGDGTSIEDLYSKEDKTAYAEFTSVVNDVMKNDELSEYIDANPDAGKEIVKAKWLMNSPTASAEEIADATKVYNEYIAKASVRADNKGYVSFATEYLNASEDEKRAMENNPDNESKLAFIDALGEDSNLGKKIRSEAMVDGKVDEKKLADILNTWKGETTTLESSYKPATGEEQMATTQAYVAKRDGESYIDAVVEGAANGVDGIKESLAKAGFTVDDPKYAALQNLWDGLDENILKAVSRDRKTAETVFDTLYGQMNGTVAKEDVEAILSEVIATQKLIDNNEEVINTIAIFLDPDSYTEEERADAEQRMLEDGSIYAIAKELGANNVSDPNDDDMDNEYRVIYEAARQEYEANGVPFDLEAKKKTILKILEDKQIALTNAKNLTDSQKTEYAAQYLTGKNTKAFTNEAVTLFSNGMSIEETKAELEKKYPAAYNRKLYSGFFSYFEEHPKLASQMQYLSAEEREGIINSVLTSINDSVTSPFGISAADSLSSYETKYDNRTTNEARNKELAPLFDDNATEEDVAKATQYMDDNALQSFVNDETLRAFVNDYVATHEGATVVDALNVATEDMNPQNAEGEFGGFGQNATSSNAVYKWNLTRSRKIDEGNEEAKTSLVSALNTSTGYDENVEKSLNDYPTYQAVYSTLTGGNTLIDSPIRNDLLRICVNDTSEDKTLTDNIVYYTTEYLTASDETDKKAAYNKLLSIAGTESFNNDESMLILGHISSEQYFDGENVTSDGAYDKTLSDYLVLDSIRSAVIKSDTKTGADIRTNITNLVENCGRRSGKADSSVIKKLAQFSDKDLENMSWQELISEFSVLEEMVRQAAVNSYTSFNAKYGSSTYNGNEYYGSKFGDILDTKSDDMSIQLNDEVYMTACSSGLCKFGETYQGREPSPNLLKQGSNISSNFYATALDLYLAEDENARNAILTNAETFLTADAIKELKEMEPINLLVRGYEIKGLEQYDVIENIKTKLKGNPSAEVVNSDPTDVVKYMSSCSYLLSDLKIGLASDNADVQRKAIDDFENKIISGYVAQIDGAEGSLASFTTSFLNPVVPDTSRQSAESVSAAATGYYGNRVLSRDTNNKSAYSKDYRIQENMKDLVSGENLSSATTTCSIKLADQSIDAETALVASDAMALSMMGIDIGLTEDSFSEDGLSVTEQKIYSILGSHNSDARWLSYFYGLSKELDTYYITAREYDALGHKTDYTLDSSGTVTFKDGSTADKENDSWIRTYGDGTTENLTLTSDSTPLSYKTEYVFGEDYVKTNASGTKSTVTLTPSKANETTDKVKNYNSRKAEQSGANIDYSTATEMVVDPEYFVDNLTLSTLGTADWQVKEVTGETLMNEYVNTLAEGMDNSEQKAEAILAQVSDGMADYIRTSADKLFARLAIAMAGDVDSGITYEENSKLMNKLVSGAVLSAKLSSSSNKIAELASQIEDGHTDSGVSSHIKELANEALGRILAKNNKPANKNATINARTANRTITGTGEAPTEYTKSNTVLGLPGSDLNMRLPEQTEEEKVPEKTKSRRSVPR